MKHNWCKRVIDNNKKEREKNVIYISRFFFLMIWSYD